MATAIGLVASSLSAHAQTLLRSTSPYWQVGVSDKELSRLCSLDRFGQKVPGQYLAQFVGPKGQNVLGVAKGSGLNLLDRDHKADKTADYFFLNQGTADCEVFVARKALAKPPAK